VSRSLAMTLYPSRLRRNFKILDMCLAPQGTAIFMFSFLRVS